MQCLSPLHDDKDEWWVGRKYREGGSGLFEGYVLFEMYEIKWRGTSVGIDSIMDKIQTG